MPASVEELLILLNKWKKDGNALGIDFLQAGQTRLSLHVLHAEAVISRADETGVTFGFGWGTAEGSLAISFSNPLVTAVIVDPKKTNSLEGFDPNFERCIAFSWYGIKDRCTVCALPKT